MICVTFPLQVCSAVQVNMRKVKKILITYCDFKADGFVTDLSIDHGGFQEGAKEEELFHFPRGALVEEQDQNAFSFRVNWEEIFHIIIIICSSS